MTNTRLRAALFLNNAARTATAWWVNVSASCLSLKSSDVGGLGFPAAAVSPESPWPFELDERFAFLRGTRYSRCTRPSGSRIKNDVAIALVSSEEYGLAFLTISSS